MRSQATALSTPPLMTTFDSTNTPRPRVDAAGPSSGSTPSRSAVWIEAIRPQTLPAAVTPVVVGASVAWALGGFTPLASLLAGLCALLIQIGTNFANDYYDAKSGADGEQRIGFQRATASGLIRPETMWSATLTAMGLAFALGLGLVWIGGAVVLWIGVASIVFGILYTGGPFPLGYNGLGDVFVFLFFGVVAVTATTYVNTLTWEPLALWASVPVGALCVNILVVNNLRDVEQDAAAGKRTLGVLLGEPFLKGEYLVLLLIAFAVPIALRAIATHTDAAPLAGLGWSANAFLLPLLSLPLAWTPLREVFTHTEKGILNGTLKKTALLMLAHGGLLAASFLLA